MTAASDPDGLLLPEGTRLLHIGPQKTGSTALQAAMLTRRGSMQEHGVTAVGLERRERRALWAALMHHDSTEPRYRGDFARWEAMVEAVDRAEGRVVVSNESLGKADDAGARRMVDALGGDRTHVVAVARRLDRLLPSQWQQRVKMNATTLSYPEWLRIVLGHHPDDPVWRNIWVPHDLEALVSRWAGAAARERMTVVVADEGDRRSLSRTIERMLGLPDGLLRPESTHKSNASLGLGRLEVVRLLNKHLEESGASGDTGVSSRLRTRVARSVKLSSPWPEEQRVPDLPAWARDRVAELSEHRAELLTGLGVRVVGDPDHLRLPPAEPTGSAAHEPGPVMVSAELAAHAIAEALAAAHERERELVSQIEREIEQLRSRARRAGRAGMGGATSASGRELVAELRTRLRRRLRI